MKPKTKRNLTLGAAGLLAAGLTIGTLRHIDFGLHREPVPVTSVVQEAKPETFITRFSVPGIEVKSVKRIPVARLRAVAKELDVVRPLTGLPKLYVNFYNPGIMAKIFAKKGYYQYDMNTKLTTPSMAASIGNFAKPDSVLLPEIFHEGAHRVFHASNNKEALARVYSEIKEKYGEATEGHPVFSLFDESNYRDYSRYIEKPEMVGHPYSNPHELFASTSSVMRHHGQRFISGLRSLVTGRETPA